MAQTFAVTNRIPAPYLLRTFYSLTGILPLFMFIALYLSYSAILLFGSKETVLTIIEIQSLPFVTVFELLFISLPLLFHFCCRMLFLYQGQFNAHQYSTLSNWRYVLQRVTGVVVFIFLLFHLYQVGSIYFGDLQGYQFIQDIMVAHQSTTWMWFYWVAMSCAVFYFCNSVWSFLIDWGITANSYSQKISLLVCVGMFVVMMAGIIFILLHQLLPQLLGV